MTLHDIQSSLDELRARHPGITEEMVGVLLAAGGWEKKSIEEAQLLFRSQAPVPALPHEDDALLPPPEEKLIEQPLPNGIREPESLVAAGDAADTAHGHIPDNLPLRPFETSPHVWPFSKYKDVFHADAKGEEREEVAAPAKAEEVGASMALAPEPDIPAPREESAPVAVQAELVPSMTDIRLEKAPLTRKDEVMIAFGAALLLAAVMLVLYMFNNGRL